VCSSLCTCKSVEERRKGETHARARLSHLAGSGGVGRGVVWCGRPGRWARVNNVGVNGPPPLVIYFCYETVSNTCLIET
jgi:hypothetical protein